MSSTWQFKVEEIFQDIDNDTENVNMIIPKEILNKKKYGKKYVFFKHKIINYFKD